MTPLTSNERSVQAFEEVVPLAQEGSVTGRIPAPTIPVPPQHAFAATVSQAQENNDPQKSPTIRAVASPVREQGKATFTNNKFKVKPSAIDFVIDVQNIARRVLTQAEFGYFKRTYFGSDPLGIANMNDPIDLTPDGEDKFFARHLDRFHPEDRALVAQYDRNIRTKLGAAFIEHGLHPYSRYMNHADEDVRKRFE